MIEPSRAVYVTFTPFAVSLPSGATIPSIPGFRSTNPQTHPELDKKLRVNGIIRGKSGSGRRPLSELLYGVIEPTERFEQMVKKHHRNGNSQADARRKAMVLYPTLYKTKQFGWLE